MKNNNTDLRPVFLDLLRIRQPITAIASIAHRVSGVLLVLSLPAVIWLLDRSLRSPESYAQVVEQLGTPWAKALVLAVAWAAAHHFFAGIRFLLLDFDIGVELETATKSAYGVIIAGALGLLLALVVVL